MFRILTCGICLLFACCLFPEETWGAPQATPRWVSGFENGWPGEWLNYGGPNPTGDPGWEILDAAGAAADGVAVPEGSHIYKAWANSTAPQSHRPYPLIHSNIPSPFVNRFYVWLDWDPASYGSHAWVSLMTLANTSSWNVVTISTVNSGLLEAAHVGPYGGFDSGDGWERIGRPYMPLRQWVPFTVYMDFRAEGDVMYVWMDDELIIQANGGNIDQSSTTLSRAHWGLYAGGNVHDTVMYNDWIQLWTLDEAWTHPEFVPPSPYEASVPGDINYDGVADDADIDLLFAEIVSGEGDLFFDVNHDDVLDSADADYLVRELMGTEYGDANFDGQVSDADYTVWADHYGASGAGWASGDFNGNGTVTEADYTLWADHYGFAAAAIPEPTTLALLGAVALGLGRRANRP